MDEKALGVQLPRVAGQLIKRGVSLRCDERAKKALEESLDRHEALLVQEAVDEDFDTEFLDLVLAVKTIPACESAEEALDLAVAHINAHGSHHTDVILTRSEALAERFMNSVDSAGVFWNASSRFADGTRFGFGTEVGISTNKIHSRGPVGLEGLCIYKYKLRGSHQAAGDYGGTGSEGRKYTHKRLPL